MVRCRRQTDGASHLSFPLILERRRLTGSFPQDSVLVTRICLASMTGTTASRFVRPSGSAPALGAQGQPLGAMPFCCLVRLCSCGIAALAAVGRLPSPHSQLSLLLAVLHFTWTAVRTACRHLRFAAFCILLLLLLSCHGTPIAAAHTVANTATTQAVLHFAACIGLRRPFRPRRRLYQAVRRSGWRSMSALNTVS